MPRFVIPAVFLVLMISSVAAAQDCIDYEDYLRSVSQVDVPRWPMDVAVSGSFAYVAVSTLEPDYDGGLQVIDIADLENPQPRGFLDIPGDALDVVVAGGLAYVASGGVGLQIIDVADPDQPQLLGAVDTGSASGLAIVGDLAYVASSSYGLQVVDISNPAQPQIVGGVDTPGVAGAVAVVDDLAYVADGWTGLQIYGLDDPTDPQLVGSENCYTWANDLEVRGGHAYVVGDTDHPDYQGYFVVVDVADPANPQRITYRQTEGMASGVGLHGNYALVADRYAGLQVYDISDPGDPAVVNTLSGMLDAANVACSGLISGSFAFIADWFFGEIRVIGIDNPTPPPLLASRELASVSRLVVPQDYHDGRYAFVARRDIGLSIIDILDPEDPQIAGYVHTPGLAQDVDVDVDAQLAFVAIGYLGLQVVEVADPTNPQLAGSVDLALQVDGVRAADGLVMVTTSSGPPDFLGALHFIDVSDPDHPEVGYHVDLPASAVDVALAGTHAFVATHAGLEVVGGIHGPSAPYLVGSLPTSSSIEAVALAPDGYLIAAAEELLVIDVGMSFNPVIAAQLALPDFCSDVVVRDGVAYIAAASYGMQVVDIVDPSTPRILGGRDLPGYARGAAASATCVLITESSEGLQILPLQCADMTPVRPDPVPAADADALAVFPNPFNPRTTVSFTLARPQHARIAAYDLRGRLLDVLGEDDYARGDHTIVWTGEDAAGCAVPSGTYLIRLTTESSTQVQKAVLLR